MHITISSIFITACISSLMIIVLNYLIQNTNKIKVFRTDFFSILILVIVLRLLIPTELFFTKTIPVSIIMNPIVEFFNYTLLSDITVLQISLIIWLLGFLFCFIRFIHNLLISNEFSKMIQKKSIHYHVSDFLNDYDRKDYSIMVSSLVKSPMVYGLNKIIFLPDIDFSETDLNNIIHHEIQHIKNRDILIKLFINLMVCIYWWLPPIYLLRKNINLFLEIRVDDQATRKLSSESKLNYINALINVQRKINDSNKKYFAYSSFIDDSASILSYRIYYLLDGDFIKKTKTIFLFALCVLPFLSNLIILEPIYHEKEQDPSLYTVDEILTEGYIVQKADGTYRLILNGEEADLGSKIPEEFSDIKIVKEK
ncbi:M56 family metallopeptidase [Erysipelotrichaceae bacterium HCN-30851]